MERLIGVGKKEVTAYESGIEINIQEKAFYRIDPETNWGNLIVYVKVTNKNAGALVYKGLT